MRVETPLPDRVADERFLTTYLVRIVVKQEVLKALDFSAAWSGLGRSGSLDHFDTNDRLCMMQIVSRL